MQTSKFKKGDRVSYKNESGVVINCTVQSVGVLGGKNTSGTYYMYEGKRYYYLETTGEGWQIGQIPDDYKSADAKKEIIL